MRYEKILLSAEDEEVYLEAYIADPVGDFTRRALLVIPGGGYNCICSDREGEPIAMAFLPHGYNAFVLHYTVGRKKPFPAQLIEAAKAICHIKDHAEDYHIHADEVFVVGFSAGGHLAASAGVLWKLPEVQAALGRSCSDYRPTGVMLIYPVISTDYHTMSFQNLLCEDFPSREALEACSIEKHVEGDSSPAFVLHTMNDQLVDVKNALVLVSAYADAGVPCELHIYPDAPHGVALANAITACGVPKFDNPTIAEWISKAAKWADVLCKNNKES